MPSSMRSLFELLPLALYATMLVLQGQIVGPFGTVHENVTVQFAPGQPDIVPHSTTLPKSLLLTMTSTPSGPLVQCSVPSRSVAWMILPIRLSPGCVS
jgi:hypothetical protein